MKTIVLTFVLFLFVFGLFAGTPDSVQAAVHPAFSAAEQAAFAPLKKLDGLFKLSAGITYTSKMSITSIMPTGDSSPIECDATVDKSGRGLFVLSPIDAGKLTISIDGNHVTLFDSTQSKYSIANAGESMPDDLLAMSLTSEALYACRPDMLMLMQYVMDFPMVFSINGYLAGEGPSPEVTSRSDVVNGKSAVIVTSIEKSKQITIKYVYAIDKATGLPLSFEQSGVMGSSVIMSVKQTFSSIKLLPSEPAASVFAFTPPTASTLVAAAQMPSQSDMPSNLLKRGVNAPNFSVKTASGKVVTLAEFAGKVVVLDFWATWCGPCQESLPHTDAIAREYQPRGVVFLPICTWDAKSAFLAWQAKHKSMAMSFYYDPAGQNDDESIATKNYKTDGIPTQYVIGRDGKIEQSFSGYDSVNDRNEKTLSEAVNSALSGSR
jgi:thiol-disulfide isomerase/thioredoxin